MTLMMHEIHGSNHVKTCSNPVFGLTQGREIQLCYFPFTPSHNLAPRHRRQSDRTHRMRTVKIQLELQQPSTVLPTPCGTFT